MFVRHLNIKPVLIKIYVLLYVLCGADYSIAISKPAADFQIISDQGTTICFGTPIIIAPDNNNSFLNPSFQWIKNNIPVGYNTGSYSGSGFQNGDSVSCIVTDNGLQFYSNVIHFTVLGRQPKIYISADKYSCSYSSAATYGSFLELGNGFDDLSFGATTLLSARSDNEISGPVDLPFKFKFAGSDFDRFSVSTNGRMAFGNTVFDSSSDNTEVLFDYSIMPWWDELTTGTNGSVRYKFFVESEFTKLVIEWNVNSSTVDLPFDRTIQLRLIYNANNIVILYGSNDPATAGTGSATIGIAGSGADFMSVGLSSLPQPSTVSSVSRTDDNIWPVATVSNPRGIAFFNACSMDSIEYGSPVVFTALIDSGVNLPQFQWRKNNVTVGTNSPVYIDSSLHNNDTIWCEIQSQTTCTVSAALSNQVIVNVKPNTYIVFNGNGNWSNAANWSDGENHNAAIPPGTAVIIAPPPTGQCILDVPVTFPPGTILIVKDGADFIVQGNLTIL